MSDGSVPRKFCSQCEQYLPPDAFYRMKSSRDGLAGECRACNNARRKRHYETHKAEHLEKAKQYRQTHGEEITEQRREYRKTQAHRDAHSLRNKRYRKAHRTEIREYGKHYRSAHRAELAAKALRWRRRNQPPERTYTADDVKAQYKRQCGKCYYCHKKAERDGKTYHIEHVIPLSRHGSNGPDNIVIACYLCNLTKHNKLPHEWPQGGRLL